MSQQYDALNRITSETFPDSETVNYTYNEAGWLNSVPGYINGITYNARGQKTSLTYATTNNLTTTWTFDPNNFRVLTRVTPGQQDLAYQYDNGGNITTITDNLFTAGRTFTYDDLNRLSTAFGTLQGIPTNCSMTYNAIGDITNKCGKVFSYGDPMHPSAVTYHPGTGKSYTYDANGNMLTRGNQTLTWDLDNRVSSISIAGGGTTHMEYDYTGMRVKKNALTGITLYPFQGYEIDPNGVVTKFIRIGVENFASKRGSNLYFYHNDHLGGVNVITDITGTRVQLNEYGFWGNVSRSEGSIDPDQRFTGQKLDPESGLYYYGGRYYDPEISRFASPDPFIQAPDNPQSLNRYSYVLNNPQNYTDPSGYSWFSKLFKSIFKFFKKVVQVFVKYVMPVVMIAAGIATAGAGFAALAGVEAGLGALGDIAIGIGSIAQGARSLASLTGGNNRGVFDPLFNDRGYVQLAQANPGSGGVTSDASPDYGLRARPPWMDEPGLDSPTIDPLDILLGIGSIARVGLKQIVKVGTTTLWRAVGPNELEDIIAQNVFRNLGSAEGKYFSTTIEGAASYAKQAVRAFGDPPYTLIQTEIPNILLPKSIIMDRNVPGVFLPDNVLPRLTPQVLKYMPLPPR